ncbi:MAG TPA: biotin/lipoyl-binding protein, partial [Chloroflexi bacterium]|nr:biotin/lipoyl-binding protein [Chloroflexota bacterium]
MWTDTIARGRMMKKVTAVLLLGVLLLAGCGPAETPTANAADETEAIPVAALLSSDVIVEGIVEPAQWAELRLLSAVGGAVIEVLVEPGDRVDAGDVIMRLDAAQAELAVRETQAAVAAAQAELASVKAGPRDEQIAAAEANVEAADAALAQAAARRDQLTGGVIKAEIAAAEAEV